MSPGVGSDRDPGRAPLARSLVPAGGRRAGLLAAFALVALVCVAFGGVLGNGFVNWDDPENLLENGAVHGLDGDRVRLAFVSRRLGVYQPLAWLMYGALYALGGLDPRVHHAASLLAHAAVAVALYALVLALLRRAYPAAFARGARAFRLAALVAVALFAVHPLRVEPVAWASSQSYLPCALFGVLSVLAYLRAADEAKAGSGARRLAWLSGALLAFAAALMFKAAAVGLAAVPLLLDVYPLGRLGPGRRAGPEARQVWAEKALFLAPAAAASALAVWARVGAGHIVPVDQFGPANRVAAAGYGACFYLFKTLDPAGLTAFYPYPAGFDWRRPVFLEAVATVLVVTGVLLALRGRVPGLLACWAAYLAIVAPHSGLVRVNQNLVAGRYSYLATAVWVVPAAALLARLGGPGRWQPARLAALAAAGLIAAGALVPLTRDQCRVWRDSEGLWAHVLRHGGARSRLVRTNLAAVLLDQGRLDEADAQLRAAMVLEPDRAFSSLEEGMGHLNLGVALARNGRIAEAAGHFASAARLLPDLADAHANLGQALALLGRDDEAARSYRQALRVDPRHARARQGLEALERKPW